MQHPKDLVSSVVCPVAQVLQILSVHEVVTWSFNSLLLIEFAYCIWHFQALKHHRKRVGLINSVTLVSEFGIRT